MHRQGADEFLLTVLDALEDLPADFAARFVDVLKRDEEDRSQAIRQLFEDAAGD